MPGVKGNIVKCVSKPACSDKDLCNDEFPQYSGTTTARQALIVGFLNFFASNIIARTG